ncbi:hypothetical protein HYH02_005197 [Chlamydomonas schloesseri]|uniref:Protein kinase domain-containing protein n=1 Tax=Chlamydomonas schloesseri TaxID=2026947 RepID=A0A835WL19_9CHLO|nr:hypothetical protein HYH02_005197 [Chlamydomonas schloesseri]|eukprot:KAG2449668.1 hypothetical protein HYH02_005197 [Chlamydomonas schloesseri]
MHASLFAAAPCGTVLVSLGSACPAAPTAFIPAGHVLPSLWPPSAVSGAGGMLPASMLIPGGGVGGGRTSGGLYFVGGGSTAIVTATTHASGGGGGGMGGGGTGGIGASAEARSSMRSAAYGEMGVMTWLIPAPGTCSTMDGSMQYGGGGGAGGQRAGTHSLFANLANGAGRTGPASGLGLHSASAAGALPSSHPPPAPAAAPSPLGGHFNHYGSVNTRRAPSALHSNGTTSTAADGAPASGAGLVGGGGGELPHEWQEVLRNIGADLALAGGAVDISPQTPGGGHGRPPMPLPSLVEMAAAAGGKGQPGLAAAVAAAAASSGSAPQMATLVPIRLGNDTVGALLLVSAIPQSAAAAPKGASATAAVAAAGGAAKTAGAGATGATARPGQGGAAPLPVWSAELLAGVAAALAECCLGPHMGEIVRVAVAARDIAEAPDLQGLASALACAVTDSLATELHVDFTVRLALVPQAHAPAAASLGVNSGGAAAQYGFMLTEQPAAAGTPQPDALLSVARGSNAPGGGGMGGGPPSRNAARFSSNQNAIDRVMGITGRPSGAASGHWDAGGGGGSFLSSTNAGVAGVTGFSTPPHLMALGGGGGGHMSGVHSFQLPAALGAGRGGASEAPPRLWKARPFSLESTLLSSLANKAARAPPSNMLAATYSSQMGPSAGGGVCGGSGLGMGMGTLCLDEVAPTGAATPCNGGHTARLLVPVGGLSSFAAANALGAGGGGGAGSGVCRVGGTVVPHVHAFVHDTDQPSGDVVLLFRTGAAGGAATLTSAAAGGRNPGVSGGASAGGGVASGAMTAPASLVLVAGCVALNTGDGDGLCSAGGAGLGLTPMTPSSRTAPGGGGRSRPATGSGMTGAGGGGWPYWPAAFGVGSAVNGGGGGGEISVCVAVYLTTSERLPTSLLCAARNNAQALLEVLLPATGMALSDAAYTELQFMLEAVGGTAGAGVHSALASAFAAAAAVAGGGAAPGGGGGGAGPMVGRSLSMASRQGGVRLAVGAQPPASPGFSTEEPLMSGNGNASGAAAAAAAAALGGRGDAAAILASSCLSGGSAPANALGLAGMDGGGGASDLSPQVSVLPTALALRGGADGPVDAGSGGGQHQSAAANTTGGGGAGTGTWSALSITPQPAVPGRGGNEASESSPRVPRSRLSHTSTHPPALGGLAAAAATGTGTAGSHTGGGMSQTITTGANVIGGNVNLLLSTNNSLMGALMGNSSVGGRSNGANAITGGGGDAAIATAAAAASGGDSTMAPFSGSLGVGASSRGGQGVQQSMLQMAMSLPSTVPPLGSPGPGSANVLGGSGAAGAGTLQVQSSCLSGALAAPPVMAMAGRNSGRANRACRRQVSELLATMPCDVSDTLTVMRTNMDILVSSFWNTLRAQHDEAAPSPHADEDLRFLRLNKVLGGGGCSTVYAGLLHGLEVAVKVMNAPMSEEEEAELAAREAAERGGGGVPDGELAAPSPAARQAQLRALMRGARELAVMQSITHPHIVQIYSYHTRVMVGRDEPAAAAAAAAAAAGQRPEPVMPLLAPAPPDMDPAAAPVPLQTVLIMECCDLGSLADALDSGMFANAIRAAEAARWRPGAPRRSHTFSQLPTIPARGSLASGGGGTAGGAVAPAGGSGNMPAVGGAGAVVGAGGRPVPTSGRAAAAGGGGGGSGGGMRAVYMTLLEVALALRHMHSMQLVHCDVKPANVLLKSSASDPRGFTCKLTDFGFVNLLQYQMEDADNPAAKPSMRYHEPVGTVTHLAPETMVQGSRLDHTVDIYAFGILMWEVFTGKAPYAEYAANGFRDVPYKVVREGMRPVFPSATPVAFRTLASACWSHDPGRRPSAAMLVASLQRLMDSAARG